MGFNKWLSGQFRRPSGLGGRMVACFMNRQNAALYDAVINEVGNGLDVLEIGFGNGQLLKTLLAGTDSRFFGIDISPDMVRLANGRNREAVRDGRLTLAEASVDDIPFKKGFDVIYSINTVYFWDDLRTGLEEIYSKLRDGGKFLNVCYTKEALDSLSQTKTYKKYMEEEFLDAARSVGFDPEIVPIEQGRSFYLKAVRKGI
jgi:SAM-dependent methyltransferase